MARRISETGILDDWPAARPVTEAELSGTFWSFGLFGHQPHAAFMVLAPNGRVGNYRNTNEEGWLVLRGQLALMSHKGLPTTIFDRALTTDGEIITLLGHVRSPGPSLIHILQRVAHPAHPLHATPTDASRDVQFLKRPSLPARPNLVVLRAGDTSLHRKWAKDIADEDRCWDLCISSYCSDPAAMLDEADYLTHQPHQRKFQAIHDLFFKDSPLWQYDRVWLPDDDLMTKWSDINLMFHLARENDLDLSQPSLLPLEGCFIAHDITRQQPDSVVRYGEGVEIMCPIFSSRALRICRGTFRDSVSGFGLDHIWPSLLGGGPSRTAVIDAVGVIHTRPFGQNYDIRSALVEEAALLNAYQFEAEAPPLFSAVTP